ncbi:hypothetical protein [Rhizobium sp. RAF56]|uniref:hypothetical protein n=1 Tax=Rhizobium sp. RAF56 TaxID=3233062 RepID=UPI003F9E0DC0
MLVLPVSCAFAHLPASMETLAESYFYQKMWSESPVIERKLMNYSGSPDRHQRLKAT